MSQFCKKRMQQILTPLHHHAVEKSVNLTPGCTNRGTPTEKHVIIINFYFFPVRRDTVYIMGPYSSRKMWATWKDLTDQQQE